MSTSQYTEMQVLEADSTDDDRDSAYRDDAANASLTMSVALSIFKYREEYGRTYHSYRNGASRGQGF